MRFSTNLPYLITYTASSASEQDEANPALRLASTRAGKMGLSCPLGIARCIPQGNTPVCHTKNPLLAKFVWSRWLDIGLDLFFFSGGGGGVYDPISVYKHAKKILANIQPSLRHYW